MAANVRDLTLRERAQRYSARWGWNVSLPPPRHLADGKKPRFAMPDGSYPIDTCTDVADAAALAHHSKSYGFNAVRSHVQRAKRALKCPDSVLPSTWTRDAKKGGQQGSPSAGHISQPLGERENTTAEGGNGAVPQFTKGEVAYGKGNGDSNCGNCRFFNGDSCDLVRGRIRAGDWCNKWRPMNTMLDDDGDGDIDPDTPDEKSDPDARARSDGDSDDVAEEVSGKMLNPGRKDEDRNEPGQKRLPKKLIDFYEIGRHLKLDDAQANKQSWCPVFPEGVFQHPEYGELVFDETTIPDYIENFEKKVRHIDPCVDIDHRNEEAAGWIRRLEWRKGVGLFALVDWNDLGLSLIKDKRYRYISAQFGEYRDEATGNMVDNVLSAITLTNFPFLKRMDAIQLAERDRSRAMARTGGSLGTDGKDRHMGTKSATLPQFVKGQGKGGASMAGKLDDDAQTDDTDMDDDSTAKRARRAKRADDDATSKAKKADDDTADDSDLDDADLDDADMDDDAQAKKSKKASINDGVGYDSDDVWNDGSMDQYRDKSEQPNRSDGKKDTTPPEPSGPNRGGQGGMKGRATSERAMTPREKVLHEQNRQMAERLLKVERELSEQRLSVTIKSLSEPHQDSGIFFGTKVLDEYEDVARKNPRAAEVILHFLNTVREDGSVLLSEMGHGGDGDEHDPITLSEVRVTRSGTSEKVLGEDRVKLAQEYAEAHKLDWNDPDDKMTAFEAVNSGKHIARSKARAR